MDKTTQLVRAESWRAIVEQCQSRPEGQTAKQWLAENDIPIKSYYYWQRKIRLEAYESINHKAPVAIQKPDPPVELVEIPAKDIIEAESSTAIIIRTRHSTIEISNSAPAALVTKLVKAVAHAL
jgi:putative transposase